VTQAVDTESSLCESLNLYISYGLYIIYHNTHHCV